MRQQKEWKCEASCYAKKTFNPIRNIIENMKIDPNPEKKMIALSIGDPTVFGNLSPSKVATEAVVDIVRSEKFNGYAPSTGYVHSREAVVKYCSTGKDTLKPTDVILCSGCSCALDICLTALGNPGQNILVPRPGFPLYGTLVKAFGVEIKEYNLVPERNWEVDLDMLEELIDSNTSAIVINNPSNPCGSVFSKSHLEDILKIAARNKVPIVADEIYNDFVFEGKEFHYIASLTDKVPVLSCGGLTKRFLVPGWRMGWIVVHDRGGVFAKEIRDGLNSLSQRIIGSNTIIQGALPTILNDTPKEFFQDTLRQVQENAILSYSLLHDIPGLHPIMPQGAMYMMVGISMENFPNFKNDLEFVEAMISEESVFCLPGKCFSFPDYVRIVLTVPKDQMQEACDRIQSFCVAHYMETPVVPNGSMDSGNAVMKEMVTNGIHQNGLTNGVQENGFTNSDRVKNENVLKAFNDMDDMELSEDQELQVLKMKSAVLKDKICDVIDMEAD